MQHTLAEYKQLKRQAHAQLIASKTLVETTSPVHPEFKKRLTDARLHYWRFYSLYVAVEQLEYRESLRIDVLQALRQMGVTAYIAGDKTYITPQL